jgi:hypothetical protein
MSSIFDGIINDGVFMNVGDCLMVEAGEGMTISVKEGRAWFNHTWTLNDAELPITVSESELVLDRIDAVVLEVNAGETVRANAIKMVTGVPSSYPERPTLEDSTYVHQHALAYIYVAKGVTEITQANITNVVGGDETPFITGILETVSLDTLLSQWRAQLDEFVAGEEADVNEFISGEKANLENFEAYIKNWFANIKGQLDEDAATHLQLEIDKDEIERILMVGLTDGQKIFSDDGTEITTIDSTGRKLVKTFTNGFLTCTSVLTDKDGGVMGTMVKNFASDGSTINTEVIIA